MAQDHPPPIDALATIPFLAPLSADDQAALAARLQERAVPGEAAIIRAGDPGDAFFIIRKGSVKVCLPAKSGGETLIDILGPGECFGELSLLDGKPRSASVYGLEPTTLWVLPRQEFCDYLRAHPDAAIGIIGVMSERIRRLDARVTEARFLGLAQRLARGLVDLAGKQADRTGVPMATVTAITQSDLAGMVGASQQRIALLLSAWQAEGLLQLSARGEIRLLRPEALGHMAR